MDHLAFIFITLIISTSQGKLKKRLHETDL